MNNFNLWWWRGSEYNFGDEIPPWLFNKMFGIKYQNPCNIKKEKNVLISVGSIMRLSSPNTEVWGSGIRNIDQSDFTKAKKYHAVRGPFSRDQLLRMGFDCPKVYGDPGLLLPLYYFPKKSKKYILGIIPHVSEYLEIKKIYGAKEGVKIIDLRTNNIEKVVDDILECEHTISTSLHGIITSAAYGIPTRWLKYSDRINGDDVKFYDFLASLDPEVHRTFDPITMTSAISKYNPILYSPGLTISKMIDSTFIHDMTQIDLDLLIKSCPIKKK
jgi:hypothetical protein